MDKIFFPRASTYTTSSDDVNSNEGGRPEGTDKTKESKKQYDKERQKTLQLEEFNLNKVFYCYSPKLKCELLNIGERYIAKSKHPVTNKYYWMFIYTDSLIEYLNNRPKKF